MDFEDFNGMYKFRPLLRRDEWKGKVWIILRPRSARTAPDLPARTWGNVVVFGDEALLNEIEGKMK
jgi:hypothetical protein